MNCHRHVKAMTDPLLREGEKKHAASTVVDLGGLENDRAHGVLRPNVRLGTNRCAETLMVL